MQTVGQLLRSEREKKSLSIKEIENATSIRSLYINAIEEDNYAVVPGEVYVKGFIRNYANYLGLNGQQMVQSYRQAQTPISPAGATITGAIDETLAEKPIKTTNTKYGILLLVSLLVVCLTGLAWWLLVTPKLAQEPPQSIKQVQPQPAKQAQPIPATPVQPVPTQSITPAQTKPVVITAKYTDQCWTLVIADDKKIYEGTPKSGDAITWEAQKNITITAGNAGGVEIVSNGQSLGKLGAKGEVVEKTFAAK